MIRLTFGRPMIPVPVTVQRPGPPARDDSERLDEAQTEEGRRLADADGVRLARDDLTREMAALESLGHALR